MTEELDLDDRLSAAPSKGLNGHIAVPGDKSISHRALILGGMAEGETRIEGLLEGQDVLHTAAAVRALGAKVTRLGEGLWTVQGAEWRSPEAPIDCGNSGTGARLLLGAAAGYHDRSDLHRRRVAARRGRCGGCSIRCARWAPEIGESDRLPVTISGGGLDGICYRSPNASAQVKSAILLAGLRAQGEVEVIEPARSRDHTEKMLRAFGCEVESEGNRVRLGARRSLKAADIMVPGDPSSAAFPLVAALIVPDFGGDRPWRAHQSPAHRPVRDPARNGRGPRLRQSAHRRRRGGGGRHRAQLDPDRGRGRSGARSLDDRRIPDPRRRRRLRRRAEPDARPRRIAGQGERPAGGDPGRPQALRRLGGDRRRHADGGRLRRALRRRRGHPDPWRSPDRDELPHPRPRLPQARSRWTRPR